VAPSDVRGEMISTPSMEPVVHEVKALGLDEASFRAFYDEALPRVYGYFLQRCGGVAHVAEDLTQETFMAAVRELRRGRRVGAAIPWVYGIARHKLVDHYRRQERAERLVGDDATAEPVAPVADDLDRDELQRALAALPAAQRAALVLRHGDGCSVPEVAEALGRSVEAVESLLARARLGFKRAYQEASR
jgi:RNA polymerase sigma-70 factor (ECF subfamily)